ncbi:heavy-metal-associated domain-containing protein [Mycolicibacterium sp. 050232]|uniref:heavy-metal-associated domain-containing protein n=1 Tax=Mycolicibacterium sp. 050232 TaxID=3113982 RepID=UPI003FA5C57B
MALTDIAANSNGTGVRRVQLDVKGMSCGACARRVQNKLNKIDGVRASVDIKTKVATIDAEGEVTVSDLCHAVQEAGYRAEERVAGTLGNADGPNPEPPAGPARESVSRTAKLLRWLTFGHSGGGASAPDRR